LGVPNGNWPKAVDTRPTTQLEVGAVSNSSEQQAEKTSMAGAAKPIAHDTWVDPKAVPGCSGRQCRFITVYREADV